MLNGHLQTIWVSLALKLITRHIGHRLRMLIKRSAPTRNSLRARKNLYKSEYAKMTYFYGLRNSLSMPSRASHWRAWLPGAWAVLSRPARLLPLVHSRSAPWAASSFCKVKIARARRKIYTSSSPARSRCVRASSAPRSQPRCHSPHPPPTLDAGGST